MIRSLVLFTHLVGVLSFDRDFPFAPNPGGFAHGEAGKAERRQVEQFLLAFDSNHAPIVGQQALGFTEFLRCA